MATPTHQPSLGTVSQNCWLVLVGTIPEKSSSLFVDRSNADTRSPKNEALSTRAFVTCPPSPDGVEACTAHHYLDTQGIERHKELGREGHSAS